MKTPSVLAFLFVVAAVLPLSIPAGVQKIETSVPDVAANPAYPLTTCPVSGERLGAMGKPVEYVYQQPGKPDRVLFFCCRGCIKDFRKNPAVYLKILDEAGAAAAKVEQSLAPTPENTKG